MLFKLFPILLIIGSCLCKWENCGGKENAVQKIEISNCNEDDETCNLVKRGNVTINITFTNVEAKAVPAKVCGILAGINDNCVNFPLTPPNDDGCQSGVKCPVTADQTNTYTASLKILPMFPSISVTVIWQLLNENGEVLVCVKIPSKIVGPGKQATRK